MAQHIAVEDIQKKINQNSFLDEFNVNRNDILHIRSLILIFLDKTSQSITLVIC